jgi:hypothetical protein
MPRTPGGVRAVDHHGQGLRESSARGATAAGATAATPTGGRQGWHGGAVAPHPPLGCGAHQLGLGCAGAGPGERWGWGALEPGPDLLEPYTTPVAAGQPAPPASGRPAGRSRRPRRRHQWPIGASRPRMVPIRGAGVFRHWAEVLGSGRSVGCGLPHDLRGGRSSVRRAQFLDPLAHDYTPHRDEPVWRELTHGTEGSHPHAPRDNCGGLQGACRPSDSAARRTPRCAHQPRSYVGPTCVASPRVAHRFERAESARGLTF